MAAVPVKAGYQILAASAALSAASVSVVLYSLNIVSDATAGTVSIYNGAASGTPVIKLNGTVSKGLNFNYPNGITFPLGCYVSLDDVHTTSVTAAYTKP